MKFFFSVKVVIFRNVSFLRLFFEMFVIRYGQLKKNDPIIYERAFQVKKKKTKSCLRLVVQTYH